MDAHAAFDPLWQRKLLKLEKIKGSKRRARGDGYYWLSQQLGIPFEDCHIGMFDVDMCKRVVEICAPYHPDMRSKKPAAPEKPKPSVNDPKYFLC